MSFAKHFPDGRRENVPAAVNDDGELINVGYDSLEGVQKVAVMTWNASLLQWERGVLSGGGSSGSAGPTTKRFAKPNANTLYVGIAAVGAAESATSWGIKKYTFDAAGDAESQTYAVGAWSNRDSLSYT